MTSSVKKTLIFLYHSSVSQITQRITFFLKIGMSHNLYQSSHLEILAVLAVAIRAVSNPDSIRFDSGSRAFFW